MAAPWLPPLLALFLVSSTALGASIPTGDTAQCSVSPQDRTDCGFAGIGKKDCLSRGCCFNSQIPGVKWCFNPNKADDSWCSVNPTNRRDCGFPGIGENECLYRGCCYDSSIPGSIWCFSGSY